MANITGQTTLNQLLMIEVDADPAASAGTAAPIGSIAFFNSGSIGSTYIKVGAANTAWNISTIQAAALTSGSIPFINTSGYLSQNNASLFWDQTNNRIGIGTNTPARPLSVVANTTAGDNGAFVDGYGANAAVITVRKANGTIGSPTAITSGQVFAEFDAIGYGTSQFAPNQTGSIAFIAAETFTNTANGTHIAFYTAPVGSITESERLRVHASGRILIGTTTDDGATQLQVTGRIAATDAIRPGNSTDTTAGNIRFNGVGFDFYRGGSWRDMTFPKYSFDDFTFASLGNGANPHDWVSVNGGGGGGSGASVLVIASGDPQGIINMTSGTTAALASTGGMSSHNGVNKISLGTWPVTVEWRVRVPVLSDGTNTYEARCGLMDGAGAVAGDPTNGVYFVYSSAINGGQWRGVTRSASTSTPVDSTVAVVAGTWYKLRAEVNSTRTNVDFYVDSGSGYVLIGSSATNIPLSSAFLRVNAKINKAGTPTGVGNVLQADWCMWIQER
jgi:hypothetical protein